jgi:hypothetical protein
LSLADAESLDLLLLDSVVLELEEVAKRKPRTQTQQFYPSLNHCLENSCNIKKTQSFVVHSQTMEFSLVIISVYLAIQSQVVA